MHPAGTVSLLFKEGEIYNVMKHISLNFLLRIQYVEEFKITKNSRDEYFFQINNDSNTPTPS